MGIPRDRNEMTDIIRKRTKRYRIEKSNGNYGDWKVLASGLLADSNTMSYIDLRINNSLPVFYKLAVEDN